MWAADNLGHNSSDNDNDRFIASSAGLSFSKLSSQLGTVTRAEGTMCLQEVPRAAGR